MPGYTKLFSSIIASTIWRTNNETRIVWITLLAMSDRRGIVEGSVPGLADMARVPVHVCRQALVELESPDPDSRSKEHDGKRILSVDGGWFIVNHAKYRAQMSSDDRREYLRQKKAESRTRQRSVNSGQQMSTLSTYTDPDPTPEADPDPKAGRSKPSRATRSAEKDYPEDFKAFWAIYPKRVSKGDAFKAWSKLSPNIEEVSAALEWQVHQPMWTKDAGQFIPYPASWLNSRGWESEPFHAPAESKPILSAKNQRTVSALERVMARDREKAGHGLLDR